jgi:hypothetical protein
MDDLADTLYDFPVILPVEGMPDPALFLEDETRPLKRAESAWIKTAIEEIKASPEKQEVIIHSAPSAPALKSLQNALQRYEGAMPVTKEQWQNFVMKKYFEQANDLDPKVSKPALDALAKTSMVGLHSDVQEININNRTTLEIEAELLQTIQKLTNKAEEKVIEGEWEDE